MSGGELPYLPQVRAYLADCAASPVPLDPAYHPTVDGALKQIPHRGHRDRKADKAAEEQIRAAFRAARTESPGRTRATPTPTAPSPAQAVTATQQEEPAMTGDNRAVLASAALAAATRGWHVFPLRPGDKLPAVPRHKADRCDRTDPWCRDGHQGWEPRATTDPARIAAGWSGAPFNVGIAAGPSGLVVIDLDMPKPGETPPPRWALPGVTDGADVLAVLCEEHGEPFPFETFTVRTRRGGLHLYFTTPPGTALRCTSGRNPGGLGWLIDTRAHGGYVTGPGSVVDLPDGAGRYETVYDRPPAPLPGWLAALLTAPRPAAPLMECRPDGASQVSHLSAYARAALHKERETVRLAVEGGRTWALNKAAYHLGQLIAAGALADDKTAERALYDAASGWFTASRPVTPAEARASIRGGIAAGKRKPRSLGPAA